MAISSATPSQSSRFKKTLINQTVILASAGLYASSALAECPGTVINGETVSDCTLTLNQAVTVAAGGTVFSLLTPTAISVSNATDVRIDNSGIISGTTAVGAVGFSGQITNREGGTIAAYAAAAASASPDIA